MYFKIFSELFIGFKAYDTRYLHFCFKVYDIRYLYFLSNIKLERLQITVLKPSHDLSKTVNFLKQGFHYYGPNVFSKLL